MEIKQEEEVVFKPITIVIDTADEAKAMMEILYRVGSLNPSMLDAFRFLEDRFHQGKIVSNITGEGKIQLSRIPK